MSGIRKPLTWASFPVAIGLVAFTGKSALETYAAAYRAQRLVQEEKGYKYKDPSINKSLQVFGGIAAGVLSTTVLQRILSRQFHKLVGPVEAPGMGLWAVLKRDRIPPRLNWRDLYRLVHWKTAPGNWFSLVGRRYGLFLLCEFIGLMMASVLGGAIHAYAECLAVPKGPRITVLSENPKARDFRDQEMALLSLRARATSESAKQALDKALGIGQGKKLEWQQAKPLIRHSGSAKLNYDSLFGERGDSQHPE